MQQLKTHPDLEPTNPAMLASANARNQGPKSRRQSNGPNLGNTAGLQLRSTLDPPNSGSDVQPSKPRTGGRPQRNDPKLASAVGAPPLHPHNPATQQQPRTAVKRRQGGGAITWRHSNAVQGESQKQRPHGSGPVCGPYPNYRHHGSDYNEQHKAHHDAWACSQLLIKRTLA